MKAILRALAVVCLPLVMIGCGDGGSSKNTDAANNKIVEMNNIGTKLVAQGILISDPSDSKISVQNMSPADLHTVQSELKTYVADAEFAEWNASQPGVVYSAADRSHMTTMGNNAQDILNAVNDQINGGGGAASVGSANTAIQDMNSISAKLANEGILLTQSDASKENIKSLSLDDLKTAKSDLKTYLADAQVAGQAAMTANARQILKAVNGQLKHQSQ